MCDIIDIQKAELGGGVYSRSFISAALEGTDIFQQVCLFYCIGQLPLVGLVV